MVLSALLQNNRNVCKLNLIQLCYWSRNWSEFLMMGTAVWSLIETDVIIRNHWRPLSHADVDIRKSSLFPITKDISKDIPFFRYITIK